MKRVRSFTLRGANSSGGYRFYPFTITWRHLTQEQRRELIRAQVARTPELSDRQIAAGLGVSDKTVGSQRRVLERTAEIPQLKTSIGADGKKRP